MLDDFDTVRTATWRSMGVPSSMTFCRFLSTLVVCMNLMLALTSSFHADNSSNDVMILTTENFDVAVTEAEHLFVQFCE